MYVMKDKKPIIAITAGDPAGIGPEICVKALQEEALYDQCRPFVVGDVRVMKKAAKACGFSVDMNAMNDPAEGAYRQGIIDVLHMDNVHMNEFVYGEVSAMCGQASFDYVVKAIDLAMKKEVSATVTGPINKESLNRAGLQFPGHTEIYGHYTGTKNFAMMLADKEFRVIHVSTHVSMLQAIQNITRERVLDVIELAHEALTGMGIKQPRIAVNGLNPHAGEHNLFGTEETDHIIPAIEEAQKKGINADGPHPPDTVFPKMKGGQYDIVVCMYHDQGHIPTKLTGFRYNHQKGVWEGMSGVNITLGLPVIRVSVDHGTAFDKAGTGEANPESMIQAIEYAIKFSGNQN
ncbi:MAG: 4-hydroxythreonine-4-phosphate dehydrogenase PdxA [Bacteroidales bacterium]|nr:4-hydroxythreonine-4-phosphate dehydrogenase PdxA [Bacteroidales bacterium]